MAPPPLGDLRHVEVGLCVEHNPDGVPTAENCSANRCLPGETGEQVTLGFRRGDPQGPTFRDRVHNRI